MGISWLRLAAVLAVAAPLWGLDAQPASADLEYWGTYEVRVPLKAQLGLMGQPLAFRLVADERYGLRYPGLGWGFFRLGPLFWLNPNTFVGTHFTTIAVQSSPGMMTQEYRGEIEPNFSGRFGDLWLWANRTRLEYRWRWNDNHFRFRSQFRVAYAPAGAVWQPYVWDEPMIELNQQGFAQNRLQTGIAYVFSKDARLDLGLMLRTRQDTPGAALNNDFIVNTFLLFTPQITPLLDVM